MFTYSNKISLILSVIVLMLMPIAYAQADNDLELYEQHYEKSRELNILSLFSESVKELDIAINIAKKNNWEEKFLNATISMGEMMRRAGSHRIGIEILSTIPETSNYPKLEVRKLGRLAALLFEGGEKQGPTAKDSALLCLDLAMKIAIEHNLESEEASMCNELGQHYMNTIGGKEAEPFIRRSVFLYENLKDSNNYMNSLCKLMHLNLIYEEFAKIDSIAKIIIPIRAGRNWYGTDQSFYRSYANRFLHVGDSLNYYRWALKEKEAAIQMQRVRTENNLNHYRISFETEKLKNNVIESNQAAEKKETELGEERNFSNDLIYTLIALGIIFLVVIVLLIRQRKLSKGLKASNARYQMLMTESNHRIKNNLQMIISMMEYASNDVKNSGPEAFKKISSKIQVISVLHKFLYADVHNENVEMALYFNEIVNLHSKMNSNEFEVLQDICQVEIKSERMIYFGLIFNELLANSFEHNKTDEQKVVITVTALSDGFILEYCDNSKHEISNGTGTGSVLIEQLVRRVKGKNYSLDKETGRYKFTFHGSI